MLDYLTTIFWNDQSCKLPFHLPVASTQHWTPAFVTPVNVLPYSSTMQSLVSSILWYPLVILFVACGGLIPGLTANVVSLNDLPGNSDMSNQQQCTALSHCVQLPRQYDIVGWDCVAWPVLSLPDLLNWKCCSYWQSRIEADRTSPKRLWSLIDLLLGCGRPPLSSAISVEEFSSYFYEKVASVCRSAEGSPDPVYQAMPPGCSFLDQFPAVSHQDVISCIMRLPNKQSFCDVLPFPVLKQVTAEVSPYLAHLFYHLLLWFAIIWRPVSPPNTNLLSSRRSQEARCSSTDTRSYRPISSLPIASKLLKWFVARQVVGHLKSNNLLSDHQSAWWSGFST